MTVSVHRHSRPAAPGAATHHAAASSDRPAPAPATAAGVLALQNAHGRPAVSVLLSTTPAPRMTPPDASRLGMLLREAERRLALESPDGTPDPEVVTALHARADGARAAPARNGLGLFVGRDAAGNVMASAHHLDVAPRDRVSLGPAFVTRDLIRSLHRTPRHLVLVVGNDRADLYDGAGDVLTAVRDGFPVLRRAATFRAHADFYEQVDEALGAYLQDNPAPLLVAAPRRPMDALLSVSRNLQRLAGTIPGFWHDADKEQLVRQVRPVLLGYLRAREMEALALLDARERQARTVSGLERVWAAARSGPVEMLAVEEDHFAPARVSADRRRITPATDPESPDVLDDAVDEIIDLVLSRGGWVALTGSGSLAEHDHIALSLRKVWSPPGTAGTDRPW